MQFSLYSKPFPFWNFVLHISLLVFISSYVKISIIHFTTLTKKSPLWLTEFRQCCVTCYELLHAIGNFTMCRVGCVPCRLLLGCMWKLTCIEPFMDFFFSIQHLFPNCSLWKRKRTQWARLLIHLWQIELFLILCHRLQWAKLSKCCHEISCSHGPSLFCMSVPFILLVFCLSNLSWKC